MVTLSKYEVEILKKTLYKIIGSSTELVIQQLGMDAVNIIEDKEFDLKDDKPIKPEPCIICHNQTTLYAPDPFNSSMNDDQTNVYMCSDCRSNRSMEV